MNEEEYIVTDGCIWERNKVEGRTDPHSIEVVDIKTGQVRYIKGGSHIKFVSGEISEKRTQEGYNRQKGTPEE